MTSDNGKVETDRPAMRGRTHAGARLGMDAGGTVGSERVHTGLEMVMPAKRKGNREKLVPLILDRIAGGETLVSVAQALGIAPRTVYKWIAEAEANDGREYLAYAREAGADTLATKADAIMQAAPQRIEGENGSRIDPAWVQHTANQAKHWVQRAAHFCPSKYGQRAQLEHSGKDGGPIKTVTEFVLAPFSAEGAGPSG